MAAKWEAFEEDGDRYMLQYRTANDGAVRPEHAALHGVTLPAADSFWDTYYPPNGWNCRCTVAEVLRDKYPESDHNEAMRLGGEALSKDTKGMFAFNPGKQCKVFPDYNPYTISRCKNCTRANNQLASAPDNQVCEACGMIKKRSDVTSALLSLHKKKGKDYVDTLREITQMKIFKEVGGTKEIYSAIGSADPDFKNLMTGAKKMASHGYSVFILPNPHGVKTGDYILMKGGFAALYDLKTISGKSSAGNRLSESIGQTKRVILNVASNYNPRMLAVDIRGYFNANPEAQEVIVLKGGKMLTVVKSKIGSKFEYMFSREYTKKK